MSYIVLNPHSLTNPSAMYRVVESGAWCAYVNGKISHLPVTDEDFSYDGALAKAGNLNRSNEPETSK